MSTSEFLIGEKIATVLIEKGEKLNWSNEAIRSKALSDMAQYMENREHNYEVLRGYISTINALV